MQKAFTALITTCLWHRSRSARVQLPRRWFLGENHVLEGPRHCL